MAEAIINNSDSEEDGELTNSTATSLKSGTMAVSETRGKMADGKQNSKKSSTRTSSRRSKRKDEMEELEQRVELRFTQMDESKPSIARNTPRANVTKDREPKVTTGTANFRSFGANKGQQKK